MKLIELLRNVTGYDDLVLYDNSAYLQQWSDWYKGKVAKFHNYKVYTGKKYVKMDRLSLGMPKKVCEDWANLLMNEKTDVTLSDEKSQENLNQIFESCDFWTKANEGIEKTFALGGGAFVVSVDNLSVNENGSIQPDGKVNVSFCSAFKVKPITIKDGKVTECAFISIDTQKANIAIHLIDKDTGNYKIYNFLAKGKDEDNLTIIEGSEYVFDTQSNKPWFFYIKPNIANNIDIDSPIGISVFANAIDILKEIDLVYDSYANEFILGKKRIFINARQAFINMENGDQQDVFDSNDVAFYFLPESDDGNLFFNSDTQALRVNEHQLALQNQLNLLSDKCGFGTEHYKFDKGGVYSNTTQIISENSDMFRNIRKHEILIEKCLTTIVEAVIYASNTFTSIKIDPETSIEIKFDDSIIEDKKAEREQDRIDVGMKIMSDAEYRSKWYNEDLETAQRKIDEIAEFSIPETDNPIVE